MKFRYYITDTGEGAVFGTNSEEVAHQWSSSEDYFVVDTETGSWIDIDQEHRSIEEMPE